MTNKPWILYFDGSNGTTKRGLYARYGWILYDPVDRLIISRCGKVNSPKDATVNETEYIALQKGLLYLAEHKFKYNITKLLCRGDSMLITQQVAGKWKCKSDKMKVLRDRSRELLNAITTNWKIEWIPREKNREADILSKAAIPTYR